MGKTRQHVMSDEVGIGKTDVNELGGGSSLVAGLVERRLVRYMLRSERDTRRTRSCADL